ncbi:MAG: M48 family metallopeptidase [Silicimonas sp.]|nr:M48 family metallopeptidase [Silicimonas sp.]
MGQLTLPGNPPVEILLRRSARAKRLSLRVSQLDGRVTLTLPNGVSNRQATDFASEKSDWIANALSKHAAPVEVGPGVSIPVEGVSRRIIAGEGRSARLLPGTITAPEGRAGKTVLALLRHMARDRLAEAVDRYGAEVGRDVGRLTLRDTRSRWGSCSSDGNLMFSWRLILAPAEVLDYVAAHEVAHLVHMDHSAAFWGVVREICPGFETPRKWLRTEGAGLHRYRFGA